MKQVVVGSDISFSIKKKASDGTYRNLDNFEDIVIYFSKSLSGGGRTIKCSKSIIEGYTQLERISETEYLAKITSDNTSYLGRGDVYFMVDFITSSERLNNKTYKLAFELVNTAISLER